MGTSQLSLRDQLLLAGSTATSTTNCTIIGEYCEVQGTKPLTPNPVPPPPAPAPPPPGGSGGGGAGDGYTPPTCVSVLPSNQTASRIDLGFLEQIEGGNSSTPYTIPSKPTSGVTLGRGVDLSRWMFTELSQAGVSRDTRLLLNPFLAPSPGTYGPQGKNADLALSAAGTITVDSFDLALLNDMAFQRTWRAIESLFASNNSFGAQLGQMPVAVQTTVFSLYYNAGPGLYAPIFMGHIGAGRFAQAAVELRVGFSVNDAPRRLREAEYLERAIINGQIPANATTGACR